MGFGAATSPTGSFTVHSWLREMPTYTVYIRIQRDFLAVRVIAQKGGGGYYEDVPQFAYHLHSKKPVAFGSAAAHYADARGFNLARVFHHPRLVVRDIVATKKSAPLFPR